MPTRRGRTRSGSFFFFFQAEDGIRDDLVTGVQTCALPIYQRQAQLLRYRVPIAAGDDWHAVAQELGLPLIVKPANEGSTLGLTKVTQAAQLPAAYELAARKYHDIALAESFIDGPEYTASILGDVALPLIRIVAPQGNYDYQNKYFTDDTQYLCPCGLPADQEAALKELALNAFRLVGCIGWGRVDLMLDAAGKPWLLEVNTSPGMTGHSLVPMAARAVGISYEDLCLKILEGAPVG